MPKRVWMILLTGAALALGGCNHGKGCPRVLFVDGAGWYTGDAGVRSGLRAAGFPGPVERFGWASLLGPLPDHLLAGSGHPRVEALARRITELRTANPDGKIVLMGLSAGTCIIVYALERLPADVQVDYVVLLSPSISSEHNLARALGRVKYRFYATCSMNDPLLSGAASAGLESGRPAGLDGFEIPSQDDEARAAYSKLVEIPWQPSYAAYGWNGGHVSATSKDFIHIVIAPRIMDDLPYPLDHPATVARRGGP